MDQVFCRIQKECLKPWKNAFEWIILEVIEVNVCIRLLLHHKTFKMMMQTLSLNYHNKKVGWKCVHVKSKWWFRLLRRGSGQKLLLIAFSIQNVFLCCFVFCILRAFRTASVNFYNKQCLLSFLIARCSFAALETDAVSDMP